MIRWANTQSIPILALDIPSGVDGTHGTIYTPAIQATATLTLALPKQGLQTPQAKQQAGELYLADISVPTELYNKININVGPIFAQEEILRLW